MKIRRAAFILVGGFLTASCSEKRAPDREKVEVSREHARESAEEADREQPDEDNIAEDCVSFVRSTKVVPARAANADCPECPAQGAEVLSFRRLETDAVTCAGDTCNVAVTIGAVFNSGKGEAIAGGLTAWIPREERSAYLSGQTPTGEQSYRVQITYKRRGDAWQAIEFDRVPNE